MDVLFKKLNRSLVQGSYSNFVNKNMNVRETLDSIRNIRVGKGVERSLVL